MHNRKFQAKKEGAMTSFLSGKEKNLSAKMVAWATMVLVVLSAFGLFTNYAEAATNGTLPTGTTHAPIQISSDADFTSANGVTGGSGTMSDPYIIEGWDIDAAGGSYGIWIRDTSAYFVIRNCNITSANNSANPPYGAGIELRNATHGLLENNTITNCQYGIYLDLADNNTIQYNDVSNNTFGIYLIVSSNNTITQNSAVFCSQNAIYMRLSHYNTVTYNNCSNNTYYSYGIYIDFANWNTISYNIACGSIYGGMYISSSNNNVISNNNFSENKKGSTFGTTGVGIYITSANYNTIDGNEISSNEMYGIYMQGAKWNTISNNTMFDNKKRAIYVNYYSDDNTIEHNTITGVPVSGITPDHYGIYIYDSDNTSVTNNNLSDYFYGMFICSASNNTVVENNVFSGGNWSIYLITDNNTIASNTISSGVVGIRVESSYNTIAGNIISTTKYGIYGVGLPSNNDLYENTINNANLTWSAGIYIENATNWNMVGNVVYDCFVGIQIVKSNNCTISQNNNVTNNSYYGIYLNVVCDTIIQSNQITKNIYGLYFETVNNTLVTQNGIKFNKYGIEVISYTSYSCNNTFSHNDISNNSGLDPEGNPTGKGISLMNAKGNVIDQNTINADVSYGVMLGYGSENNTVTNNKITNHTRGVYITSSNWNTLMYNNISYNSMYGVHLSSAKNNTITYNAFCNNTNYAISISSGSTDNIIHHNNFWGNNGAGKGASGNSQAADDAGGNKWYDTATNQGNYWSNWDGTGTYPIAGSAGASDSGPLAQPVPISETTPLAVFFLLSGALAILSMRKKRNNF
ncbi:MAG: NosD domain-containing protein [Thermoplasmata archaeon]